MSNETNRETEVVYLVNPIQELAIEANLAQEPKAKANFAQELTAKPIEVQNAIDRTLQVLPITNMLLLLSLLIRRTRETKPLLDYSKSLVVTSYQYLGIPRKKAMQKKVVDKERVIKRQGKETRTTQ
jgi:hypothetical protein